MKIHVSELSGAALDWAVGIAVARPNGNKMMTIAETIVMKQVLDGYSPSTDWAQCGPLIDQYHIWLCHEFQNDEKMYTTSTHMNAVYTYDAGIYEGRTAQVAICRAVVAIQLGEEVDIPDELVG